MSVLINNDHGLKKRNRAMKEADREHRRKLTVVRERISSFLDATVSDADRRLLAEVFVTEENALSLCEERSYSSAIALLHEQQARHTLLAADALQRLVSAGVLVSG